MAESFSDDIIKDIFLRLPAKLLMRCKCVCKRWRSLISDPDFVKLHLQRLKEKYLILSQRIIIGRSIIFGDDPSSHCPFATIDCEALDRSEGRAVLPHTIKPFSQPCIVGSCDGLVCFLHSDKFLIYNPTTREYSEFRRSGEFINYKESFHGFGYDSLSRDYKIVEGIAYNEVFCKVEIYSLKAGSRRSKRLHIGEESRLVVSGREGVVYWNGALHWYVHGWMNPRNVIMSFDLSEEEFHQKLSVPEVEGDSVFGGLGIHGASLFIYSSGPGTLIEAWITDEYGRGGSWTKWFSVDCIHLSRNILFPLAYTRSGKILFQMDNNLVILFNPEDNTYKDDLTGEEGSIHHAIYLETLVSPCLGTERFLSKFTLLGGISCGF